METDRTTAEMDAVLAEELHFVRAVIHRPRMYTLNGTFDEIIAFLEGYHSGVAAIDPSAPGVVAWQSFRGWLMRSLGANSFSVFDRFKLHYVASDDLGEVLDGLVARFQKVESKRNYRM
ncbi:MAG: hypothetical protein V4671_05925 [Armatimonadota bacterium]